GCTMVLKPSPYTPLAEEKAGQRGVRRWFQYHRAACGQAGSDLGDGRAEREVPRRDRGDRADRAVHQANRGITAPLADEFSRHLKAGEIPELGGRLADFAASLREWLTLLIGDQRRELVRARGHGVGQGLEGSAARGGVGHPGTHGLLSAPHRLVELLLRAL